MSCFEEIVEFLLRLLQDCCEDGENDGSVLWGCGELKYLVRENLILMNYV